MKIANETKKKREKHKKKLKRLFRKLNWESNLKSIKLKNEAKRKIKNATTTSVISTAHFFVTNIRNMTALNSKSVRFVGVGFFFHYFLRGCLFAG